MSLPHVGLVQACDDPKLLGFPLWPRQRELLGRVEVGPRMHIWALGRRSSKSTMKALVGLWCCLLRPELLTMLRPGERGYAVGVATNQRQARLLVQAALSIVERSPLLAPMIESVAGDEILFRNETAFAAFPCSARGGRGWPIFALLMDEAAHFLSETEGPQVADRVLEALLPATAQFGNEARVIIGSTPYGTGNMFADMHARATSGELPDAHAERAPTSEMNPTIEPGFLAQEEARDPESFRSEYLAEFVGSGAAFLDPERIDEAVADRAELPPSACLDWVAGLDAAFSNDPFGVAIVGRNVEDRRLLQLGLIGAWVPSRVKADSYEAQREIEDATLDQIVDVLAPYQPRIVIDQYQSRLVSEYFRRRGFSVTLRPMTASTKTSTFQALRAELNMGALELYGDSDLIAELRRLRTKYAAGAASVVNPRVGGSHGDRAQALALAVAEHTRYGQGGELLTPRHGDLPFATVDSTRTRRWYDDAPGLSGRTF